jgi:2-haloacid dehalogenase
MKIEAVVFDAYGTLFDLASVTAACEAAFPGRGAELGRVWRAKQLEYTWLRSLMGSYADFWSITDAALLSACGIVGLSAGLSPGASREGLMRAYLRLDVYPDVLDALRSLGGYRLAVLSNGSPAMLDAAVRNAGLDSLFDCLISVDEAATYKPSPAVYGLGPLRLGVPAGAIAFVSSNYWDAAGAARFGFRTFWINRAHSAEDDLGARPDAVLATLGPLRAAIEAL